VLIRDEAIVLRMMPWSNTSRMIVWLTRGHGKILTLIRGAQRPKSFFLGQADLFYACDLVFYAREHRFIHAARECAPLRTRPRLRTDWRACAAASCAADEVHRALPCDAPAPEVHALLEQVLAALDAGANGAGALAWFDLRLLSALGLRPCIRTCAACGEPHPHAGGLRLSIARGGFLCPGCAPGGRAEDTVPVPPAAIVHLARLQEAEDPAGLPAAPPGADAEAHRVLSRFLRHHLNLALPSRDRASELLGF
jgi:DNA repair protein RecO (recombination protein O)